MSEPNAIMRAIAGALPLPWTVEVTFRTSDGRKVFTWTACEVTGLDQTVSIKVPVGTAITADGCALPAAAAAMRVESFRITEPESGGGPDVRP